MAFSDPQTITINAIANTLPRTSSGDYRGSFTKDDGTVRLTFSHAIGKRTRSVARVDHSKIAPNPLIAAENIKFSMSISLIVDTPDTGYTITEQKQVVDALIAYLSASSGANVTKILGRES